VDPVLALSNGGFDHAVRLPAALTVIQLRSAIDFVEESAEELIDLQGGKPDPPPNEALESKGSTRPWAIQSHYDHAGWYIVWRYAIDPTKRMK